MSLQFEHQFANTCPANHQNTLYNKRIFQKNITDQEADMLIASKVCDSRGLFFSYPFAPSLCPTNSALPCGTNALSAIHI